tara:strand:+ start:2066 stop:3346 length:1281 start_codon:yes stop_codon:yes gene_type:complete
LFSIFRKPKNAEKRASLENPAVPINSDTVAGVYDYGGVSSSGVVITLENALEIPAILCAQQFIASTIASLPLNVFVRGENDEREKSKQPIQNILHNAINDECSSFDWRKYLFERVLTGGRGLSFIQRNGAGRVVNLYNIDPSKVTIKRRGMNKEYVYNSGQQDQITYSSRDIIDLTFSLESDMLTAISPVLTCKDALGKSKAACDYGARIFNSGGVPPFVMTGNFQSKKGLDRAADDVEAAVKKSSAQARQVLTLPEGHEIKSLGFDPEKMQMTETERFAVEEVARIYNLPPSFLQDLTHGTFSNVEQQDLHLVKHTIRQWVTQFEQELNLKLFGRYNKTTYAEFNLDGLLRGDFKTRMEGYSQAINNSVLKPSQVHAMENIPTSPEADVFLIQGATVPLSSQPTEPEIQPNSDQDNSEPEGQEEI